ncbi:AraC family transcriptional regulator [Paenibacillus mesophilus]|uniref:AraC family transcriptional regulator n=1 Tax=Paenibacillus mesophilus TaxID=2582849 RepID=UPI001305276C|nr:AraC family transcriptional regulator [Paenibacillus mesophilus]
MNYYSIQGNSHFAVKWTNQYKVEPSFLAPHSNPHYELIMISDGPVYLQVNDEKLTLKTGDVLLIPPWTTHRGWRRNDGQGSFFWVQFTIDPEPSLIQDRKNLTSFLNISQLNSIQLRTTRDTASERLLLPRLFNPAQRYECLLTLEQMVDEFHHPKGYFNFRLSRYLCKFIELLAEDALRDLRADTSLPASYTTYRRLIDCLHESYAMECSAPFFEKLLDRRYEYLCQLFKKYSGMTISAYLQQLRIQKAKHLLRDSNKSIMEISAEIGMEDSVYFGRMFKKIEGLTPTQYRMNR